MTTRRSTGAARILIVEDTRSNMTLLRDLLEHHGYETLETGEGLKAVDLAREHLPDLILLNIQLAGVSGLEVARWLKDDARTKLIPIIAVTAFAMREDKRKVLDAGCDAYISKPITDFNILFQTIEAFLSEGERGKNRESEGPYEEPEGGER